MAIIKNLSLTAASAFALLLLPLVSLAADFDDEGVASGFLVEILDFINGVLIPFILGIAFLFFVWGVFQYFIAGGANEEKKEAGRSLLIYSILGFVLIIVFWGVINLLGSASGLEGEGFDGAGTFNQDPIEITE